MQYNAKAPYLVETHWQIDEVLDGDSIIISNLFTRLRKEIRLYGLDAPEVKYNRKMKEDEQKTRLAAQFLIQLGLEALHYVLEVAPPKTVVTIITEQDNFYDYWNRQLGYVILPGGECLNDLLLINGFAKVTDKYFCSKLADYQLLNRQAQLNELGIYSQVKRF